MKYNRTVTNTNLADLIRAAVRYARVPSKVRFERFRHHNMFVDGSMYVYTHVCTCVGVFVEDGLGVLFVVYVAPTQASSTS